MNSWCHLHRDGGQQKRPISRRLNGEVYRMKITREVIRGVTRCFNKGVSILKPIARRI